MNDFAAWWGAIVATALGVIQLRQWWRARVIVKVGIRDLQGFVGQQLRKTNLEFLLVTVVNHLDHPISVSCISFIAKGPVPSAALLDMRDPATGTTWTLPVEVAAHGAHNFPIPWAFAKGLRQLQDGGYIEIGLSTGESHRSRLVKPTETPTAALVSR